MVLDEKLEPVPAGTAGRDLHRRLRGRPGIPGRARAHRGPVPPRSRPGPECYRTGDLGRWRADGELELTGRTDRQLKVLGFRVEPAEIESALASHPDIGQVTVVPGSGPGPRLAARYTLRRPDQPGPTAASLRRFLHARLPGYMVPAVFVALEPMPPPTRRPGRPGTERRTPIAGRAVAPVGPAAAAGPGRPRRRLLRPRRELAAGRRDAGARAGHVRDRPGPRAPADPALLRDPTLRGFARAADRARAGRLRRGRGTGRGPTSPGRRNSGIGDGGNRHSFGGKRRYAGAGPAAAPRRAAHRADGFSRRAPAGDLLAAPARGSGAWSGRATPRTPGSASPRPRPATSCPSRPRTGWCRCPATSPPPAWACPPASSASWPRHRRDLPRGRGGELHLPVLRAAGRQRDRHPRGDPAGRPDPGHSRPLRLHHRGPGRPGRGGRARGHRGHAAGAPRPAAHRVRGDQVRGGGTAQERRAGGPAGLGLPSAGHRREPAHRGRGTPRPSCAR